VHTWSAAWACSFTFAAATASSACLRAVSSLKAASAAISLAASCSFSLANSSDSCALMPHPRAAQVSGFKVQGLGLGFRK
jgi:hypothetical protein